MKENKCHVTSLDSGSLFLLINSLSHDFFFFFMKVFFIISLLHKIGIKNKTWPPAKGVVPIR